MTITQARLREMETISRRVRAHILKTIHAAGCGQIVGLCSEAASYVTGHALAVDGGYLA
jgi:NAD(P)-dependent dehydrogenase (short-subunit alcohol dehydrogenase family)